MLAQTQGLVEIGTNNTLQTPEGSSPEQAKKPVQPFSISLLPPELEQRNFVCIYLTVSRRICIYTRPDTGVFTHVELCISLQTVPLDSAGLLLNIRNYTSELQQDVSES